jgi:hypothetical protein
MKRGLALAIVLLVYIFFQVLNVGALHGWFAKLMNETPDMPVEISGRFFAVIRYFRITTTIAGLALVIIAFINLFQQKWSGLAIIGFILTLIVLAWTFVIF